MYEELSESNKKTNLSFKYAKYLNRHFIKEDKTTDGKQT